MRPGGLLLVIAGVWVLTQVLAGDALQRLGLIEKTEPADDAPASPGPGFPTVPRPPGYAGPTDGWGRPL